MKKANFTHFHPPTWAKRSWRYCLAFLTLMVFGTAATIAQPYCSMACNDNVNVSLNQDCEALITYDVVLEDGDNPATCKPNGPQAFIVELVDDWGNVYPSSPYADGSMIGETITVQVTHIATGNQCWGSIYVEDKQHPYIDCFDQVVECHDDTEPSFFGPVFFPAIYDNCDPNPDYNWYDVWTGLSCNSPYSGYITRTWTATDAYGNQSTCTQRIYLERYGPYDVEVPPNRDDIEAPSLDCGDDEHPDNTGWPTVDGWEINVDDPCDVSITWEDEYLPGCGGSYKILRDWTILFWCTGYTIEHEQLIKFKDDQPPVISCVPTLYWGTDPYTCDRFGLLPEADVSDNCSEYEVITYTDAVGYINGNGGLVTLPVGWHDVYYTATDACGNVATCVTVVHVIDDTPPQVVCDAHTVVTLLPQNGCITVNAETFDDGSHDNCCPDDELTFEVRRMSGGAWDDEIEFCCADACSGPIMVVLRVTDCHGNSEVCMVEVEVDDKTPPLCIPEEDVWIYCDEDPWGLFTTPYIFDACGYDLDSTTVENIDNCGEGFIRRTWTATDPCGNSTSCSQRINIHHKNDWSVRFPIDGHIEDCNGDCDNEPQIIGDDCELIGMTYEDEVFTIVPDACYKIVRTWKVINWCVWDVDNYDPGGNIMSTSCVWRPGPRNNCSPNNGCNTAPDYRPGTYRWLDDGDDGYVEYRQVIKVLDMGDPTVDCSSECVPNTDDFDGPTNNDCHKTRLSAEATDLCTPQDDLVYYWKIYYLGCANNPVLVDEGSGNGGTPSFVFMDPTWGKYKIHWTFEDRCGNTEDCVHYFDHVDCKKPTPYCVNGISIDIMPTTGEIAVWATDLDFGSFDNCTYPDDLVFRINTPSNGPGATTPPSSTSVTFTCADQGTQTVDMWVGDAGCDLDCNGVITDDERNWDYCSTYVIVQDNMDACPDIEFASISGVVENEEGNDLEEAMVEIEGNVPGIPDNDVTGGDGSFAFPNLPMHHNYVVSPEKDTDPLNGVSTYDLVKMSQHILQIELLDGPYKIIAADVNKSGAVSAIDLVQLRSLILQITTDFPDNTSWRFVDADFVFPNASNPWETTFPEIFTVNDLTQNEEADFVAIKIGDVNTSAQTSGLIGEGDDRNADGALVFSLEETQLEAGEQYEVAFRAKDFSTIYGYQFTLEFDQNAIEIAGVEAGTLPGLTKDHFGWNRTTEGVMTTSWYNSEAVTKANGETLFTMVVKAKSDVLLSDVLSISSEYTDAEAYDANGYLDPNLVFEGAEVVSGEFELYQNQPNPFKDETAISFNLPEAMNATVTIYDVAGKVLKVYNGDYSAGYNQINVSRVQLAGTGVLYYTLETADDTATRKMIIME